MPSILDDLAIDRPPAVSSFWTPFLEAFLIICNLVGFGCGLAVWGIGLKEANRTTYPVLSIGLVLFLGAFYGCWLLFPMVKTLSYLRRWRRAAQVYEATWIKERLREVSPLLYEGRLFGRFAISIPVWVFFIEHQGGSGPYHLWSILLCFWLFWVFIEWRHLRYLRRLRDFILTTEAPSSHSVFAPKQ